MPDSVQNLFRDLRDRRLLPVVIVLLLAIVAVPILLHNGSDSAPSSAATAADVAAAAHVDGAEIAQPVVLTDVHGIRDYHRRLQHLESRNPFKSELPAPPKPDKGGSGGSQSGSSGTTAATSGTTAATSGTTSATSSTSSSSGSSSGSTGTTTTPQSGTTTTPKTKTHRYVYRWEIDVKVKVPGKPGETKDGVKQLAFVPGDTHPVLQFIRGDLDESKAVFVVSREVGDTKVKGRCAPSHDDCQFLLLHVGDTHTFKYDPNGVTYQVKLTGVHLYKDEVKPKQTSAVGRRDQLALLGQVGDARTRSAAGRSRRRRGPLI